MILPPYATLPPQAYTKAGENIQAGLQGELPEDVRRAIDQRTAEYGVASGMPGAQIGQYRGLRDLGLTSLQRQDQATAQVLPFMYSPLQGAQAMEPKVSSNGQPVYHGLAVSRGARSAPMVMQAGGGGGMVAAAQHGLPPGGYQSTIGGAVKKYAGGGSSGTTGISEYSNPMSGIGRSDNEFMSNLAALGLLPEHEMPAWDRSSGGGGGGGYAEPGFYAGGAQPTTEDLANMGVIDPSFSQPASTYTGNVNSDYYDDLASGYSGSFEEWSDYG